MRESDRLNGHLKKIGNDFQVAGACRLALCKPFSQCNCHKASYERHLSSECSIANIAIVEERRSEAYTISSIRQGKKQRIQYI